MMTIIEVSMASKKKLWFVLVNHYTWPTVTTLETGHFDPEKRLIPVEPNPIPYCVRKEDGES